MDQNTSPETAARDLRRDRRFQVAQPAVIAQPGHTGIACEIRDFCFGGLFLRFTNPEAAIASLAQRADAEVEIVFSPATASATQTFRLPAQLKRLSPLGVGVAFARTPTEAVRALQKLRMAGHRQKLAALPVSSAHSQLREAATTLLTETLQQTHDQMMHQLGDKLGAAAVQATGIAEHSGLLSAVHEFNRAALAVQGRFVQRVLDHLTQARPAQPPAGQADGGLALVDELDFEDWLATSSEANKLEEQFHEQLADLEPRIGQMFGFSCDHANNPFGPAVIGHAYRGAIEDIEVPARARQVAYTVLRDTLSDQLAPLYAELLALLPLADAPPLPAVPAAEPGSSGDTTAATTADAAMPQASADAAAGTPSSGATTPPAPQGALGRMAGSLLDFFRGAAAPAGGGAPSSAGGIAPPAGIPSAAPPSAAGAPRGASPSGPAFGVAHSPVLQRLAAAGALPPAVTHEMQRSVDMFGALFDTMHAEKSVSEGMKPFFHQLETSLIKLAMSDPQFLASPTHPAHKVLNTLDRISMVAGDDGKITDQRLLRLMNRWTDRIHAEADKNPGVFDEARTQLERVVKPLLGERTARVFRLQEMCEGRQSAEVTKQRILQKLLSRLDERPLPGPVIELLNGGWRNVLLIAEMRNGLDSEEAREAWQVLEHLSDWLDPDSRAPATSDIQALLQRVDQSLTQVSADKFAQDRIVDQLAASLIDQDAAGRRRAAVSARLNEAAAEPLSEAQDHLVERLRVGDWLRFRAQEAPLNLIWIGDRPPVYVFANYRGIKKLDLKRTDLLAMLENGEAEWMEDQELPLMDRSYSAMIQKMQRDLVWQASHDPATGLANRKTFFRAIRRAWLRGQNGEGHVIGVVRFDIASPAGETAAPEIRTPILRETARLLADGLPGTAQLARAGESGLAYWCAAVDADAARAQAQALLRAAGHVHEIGGVRYRVHPVIGLAWTADGLTPETDYDNANAACASAHETGTPVVSYRGETGDGDGGVLALAQRAHDLTRILANNQLALNLQPVVAAADAARTPLYHEVRLHPTVRGETGLETRDLVAVAERLQRIAEIDRWVVRRVFQWMRDHADPAARANVFAIHLSGQSVVNPLFLKFVVSELARGDLPGDRLIFGITETDAVEGHAQTQRFMRQLQRYGCRFTLDEFGTGTSAYTSLKSMKLDYLKLDRALVREIATSMIDEALVRSIVETGKFLGVQTVAGHVEDSETLAKLTELGVDCVQGFLIGAPVALESLPECAPENPVDYSGLCPAKKS